MTMDKFCKAALGALLVLAAAASAGEFPLGPGVSLGTITALNTDTANYNLNDDSWLITATPVMTNRLASSTNDVVLRGVKLAVQSVTVRVHKYEVYAALGVPDFTDTKLLDFQAALMQVAMYKVYAALTPPAPAPEPEPEPAPEPEPEPEPEG